MAMSDKLGADVAEKQPKEGSAEILPSVASVTHVTVEIDSIELTLLPFISYGCKRPPLARGG
jgi:hypothetical protein